MITGILCQCFSLVGIHELRVNDTDIVMDETYLCSGLHRQM